jgi:hypothetical protein
VIIFYCYINPFQDPTTHRTVPILHFSQLVKYSKGQRVSSVAALLPCLVSATLPSVSSFEAQSCDTNPAIAAPKTMGIFEATDAFVSTAALLPFVFQDNTSSNHSKRRRTESASSKNVNEAPIVHSSADDHKDVIPAISHSNCSSASDPLSFGYDASAAVQPDLSAIFTGAPSLMTTCQYTGKDLGTSAAALSDSMLPLANCSAEDQSESVLMHVHRSGGKDCPQLQNFTNNARVVLLVAMDRGGAFEANLNQLFLQEGFDYYHFA